MKDNWFSERLKKTVYDLLKLSVITWIVITAWMMSTGMIISIAHFSAYLGFTAAVMGLSKYFEKRNPPAGGAGA